MAERRGDENGWETGRDVPGVCPRDAIDESVRDICGREAIDEAASKVCPREAIEEDTRDICGREAIDDAAANVCPREAIEEDAKGICSEEAIAEVAANMSAKPVPPLIGIVPTQVPGEHILRVNDYYINSIVLAGGVPLIFPLTYDKHVYERLFPVVDGFVLTGGQDVDPERYGAGPEDPGYEKIYEVTPLRDSVETAILDFAYTYDVPLLGICRGMQTMNVYFGGTLYVDIAEEFAGVDSLTGKPVKHWQDEETTEVSHYVDVERGTKLHDVFRADSAAVNSFHHQGVKKVGEGFRAVAWASDGLVEAIEAEDRTSMVGVQWHPEFFLGDPHSGGLFSWLVTEAAQARASGRLAGHEGWRIEKMADKEPDHGVVLLHAIKKRYSL